MGISLMVMLMVVIMVMLAAQKRQALGSVYSSLVRQKVCHKVLQPGSG